MRPWSLHRFQTVLELTAVLGPGDQRPHVQGQDPLVLEGQRDVAGDHPAGQAFHDGRLAHARFADQHRVVLGPPREHLHHSANFVVTADHRVELALAGQLGEVAAVAVQGLKLLLGVGVGDPLVPAKLFERAQQTLRGDAETGEDPGDLATVEAGGGQQQVFGADILVLEIRGHLEGAVEQLAQLSRELGLGRVSVH